MKIPKKVKCGVSEEDWWRICEVDEKGLGSCGDYIIDPVDGELCL